MSSFIIGALLVAAFWMYFNFKSNVSAHTAFSAIDEAESWLSKNGLIPSTVKFSNYSDPDLVKNKGANVVVGFGETRDGERKGIVLEILEGEGVLEGMFIDPPALTSHHRAVSLAAKTQGVSLIDAMQEKARLHRQEYSES